MKNARMSTLLAIGLGSSSGWAAELAGVSPAAASNFSGSVGLWVGIAAAILLGAWFLIRLLRGRNAASGTPGVPRQLEPGEDPESVAPRGYCDKNVGNDASARPWERHGPGIDAGTAAGSQGGSMIESMLMKKPDVAVPDGFDTAAFLKASKANFVALQEAWNRSDVAILRAMMTDEMLAQIQTQLADRETTRGGAQTEVVMLNAHLVGIEDQGADLLASLEFSGLLREDPSAGPNPFRELWSITRPKSGAGGWLVAGVQSLQ